jgi:hypothetical protein
MSYSSPLQNNHLPAIHKAINFYQQKLMEKYPFKVLTPALLYEMNDYLLKIQAYQANTESHPVWKMPVEVVRNPQNAFLFCVVEKTEPLV